MLKWRIQDLPWGGPWRARAHDRGLCPWSRPQGQSWWRVSDASLGRRFLKLKTFCPFSYKRGPKVKDLSQSWPMRDWGRLLFAAMTSANFWSVGEGGCPVCPCPDPPLSCYTVIVSGSFVWCEKPRNLKLHKPYPQLCVWLTAYADLLEPGIVVVVGHTDVTGIPARAACKTPVIPHRRPAPRYHIPDTGIDSCALWQMLRCFYFMTYLRFFKFRNRTATFSISCLITGCFATVESPWASSTLQTRPLQVCEIRTSYPAAAHVKMLVI